MDKAIIIRVPLDGKVPSDIGKEAAIYKISVFLDKEYIYIGQASNLRKRIKEHRWALKSGKHLVPKILASATADRFFNVTVLETPPYEFLTEREQYHIDTSDKTYLLNTQMIATAPKTNISKGLPVGYRVSRNCNKKAIVGISLVDNSILKFESMRAADRDGFNAGLIQRCVAGFIAQHRGVVWMTVEEYRLLNPNEILQIQSIEPHKFSKGVYSRKIVAVKGDEVLILSSTKDLDRLGIGRRSAMKIINSTNSTHKGYRVFDYDTWINFNGNIPNRVTLADMNPSRYIVAVKGNDLIHIPRFRGLADLGFDKSAVVKVINTRTRMHKGYLFFDLKVYEDLNVSNP